MWKGEGPKKYDIIKEFNGGGGGAKKKGEHLVLEPMLQLCVSNSHTNHLLEAHSGLFPIIMPLQMLIADPVCFN